MDDVAPIPPSTDVPRQVRRSPRPAVDHLALVLGTRHVCPEEHAFLARAYLQAAADRNPGPGSGPGSGATGVTRAAG